MKLVEPKVFLIGRSCTNPEGVREWLTTLGVSPSVIDKYTLNSISPGEGIVQLAGKRCYNAFEVGLNKNITKIREDISDYIDNILQSGHGCYDEETEVLTDEGWKRWTEVDSATQFATLVDDRVEYQSPTALQEYTYTGPMYKVDSPGVDLLVTPNHRMYVSTKRTKGGAKNGEYKCILAQDLDTKTHYYKKNIDLRGKVGEITHLPIMQLLGFTIGDGYIESGQNSISFHLKKQRKIKYLHKICNDLGIEILLSGESYRVTIPTEYRDLFCSIYNELREKVIPSSLLVNSDFPTLMSLYDGLINSDGSISKSGIMYDTTSQILAGQIQHLCLLLGCSANISQASCYKERKASFGQKPIYRLYIIERNNNIEVNKKSSTNKGKTYWIENWTGQVYCCTIPNGLLYVRRNGKPVWCGNSVLEHVVYNFAIENVSRVFTAEMNRHRAGMAISEGSLRYIRYSDIPFWMPHSILPNENDTPQVALKKTLTRGIFILAFSQMEENYKELEKIWELDTSTSLTFSFKKQLTSLFRRIIGMGVATGGVWSGNLRALRHICELRSEPHVEEEMILVVSLMLNILLQYESNLFGDFSFEDNYWKPQYSKV